LADQWRISEIVLYNFRNRAVNRPSPYERAESLLHTDMLIVAQSLIKIQKSRKQIILNDYLKVFL
jgi:hypothetical protein